MKLEATTKKLAKIITLHAFRNTFIEELHAGTHPGTNAGDYSDVKVVTPYGKIPWNNLSRISDEEMEKLNKEVVDKIYTFLYEIIVSDSFPNLHGPTNWDEPKLDEKLKRALDRRKS